MRFSAGAEASRSRCRATASSSDFNRRATLSWQLPRRNGGSRISIGQAGPPIAVRIGIHTGEPTVSDSLDAGLDVHRAARVMAAAHGGQVLLSARTVTLLAVIFLTTFVCGRSAATCSRTLPPASRSRRWRAPGSKHAFRGFAQNGSRHASFAGSRGRSAGTHWCSALSLLRWLPPSRSRSASSALRQLGSRRTRLPSSTRTAESALLSFRWVTRPRPWPQQAAICGSRMRAKRRSRESTRGRSRGQDDPCWRNPRRDHCWRGAAWVLNSDLAATKSTVSRVDLRIRRSRRGSRSPPSQLIGSGAGISWDGRDIWAATQAGSVFRISPRTERVLDSVAAEYIRSRSAPAAGSVWVANRRNATVSPHRCPAMITGTVPGRQQPTAIAAGAGALWVADAGEDAVRRIEPRTGSVVATIHVGRQPEAIAASSTDIWVGNSRDRSVMRIDPRTTASEDRPGRLCAGSDRHQRRARLGRPPTGAAGGAHCGAGQTLHLLTSSPGIIDSLDPPLAYTPITWQIEYATCARLYNHPDAAPPRGYRILPEIASELPALWPTADIHHPDPPRVPVLATVEPGRDSAHVQVLDRTRPCTQTKSFARNFLTDIVGVDAYQAGKARHISGLSVRGTDLLIRLVHPAGSLAARLAMPFFCPVPIGTPQDFKGLTNIPSARPYFITSYVPNKRIILRRNPNYHGARPRRSGTIEITPRPTEADALHAVEANRADAIIDPSGREPIPARYASREVRVPLPTVRYLALNALEAAVPRHASAKSRRARDRSCGRGTQRS